MTTNATWRELDSSRIFPRVPIVSEFVKRVFGNLNTAYQSLFDVTNPSGVAQVWAGHDHGDEGGVGLIRNSQYTADDYSNPIFSKTDYTAGQAPNAALLGEFYTSPGLADQTLVNNIEIAVCCKSVNAQVDIWSGLGQRVTVEPGGIDWYFLKRPVTSDTSWFELYLYSQPTDPTAASGLEFYIYSINLVETYEETQPLRGNRKVETGVPGENTIYSYFDVLCDELADTEEWLDAIISKRAISAMNFMIEGVLDIAAPGASTQALAGHDHCAQGDGGNGGRAIGMGKIFSAWRGATTAGTNYYVYKTAATTQNTWEYADTGLNANAIRTNGLPSGPVTTDPQFKGWVTAGFASSGNPPASAPYLDGWVMVHASSGTATVDVRIYNLTTATYSNTITSVTLGSWQYIDGIPCSDGAGNLGAWNDFAIEVKVTNEESVVVETLGIVITESYKYSGSNICYNSSTGTRVLGIGRSGIEVVPTK